MSKSRLAYPLIYLAALPLAFQTISVSLSLGAEPGYRYELSQDGIHGKCISRSGLEGFNHGGFGECSMLDGKSLFHFGPIHASAAHHSFRGASMRDFDFKHLNISGSDFSGAILVEADLSRTRADGALLIGSDLQNASLQGARLLKARFVGAKLDGAKFTDADLRGAVFDRQLLAGADFSGADLRGADLSGAREFMSANFRGARFDESSRFPAAIEANPANLVALKGMIFQSERNLKEVYPDLGMGVNGRAEFQWIQGRCLNASGDEGLNPSFFGECGDLRGIDLTDFAIRKRRLSGAWLGPIDLGGKDLYLAQLNGAILDGANFQSANLMSTELQSASLRNASFQNARIYSTNFEGADLRGARFGGAVFILPDFKHADLRGADLRSQWIQNCDWIFEGALIDENTKLPFSREDAVKIGHMVYQ